MAQNASDAAAHIHSPPDAFSQSVTTLQTDAAEESTFHHPQQHSGGLNRGSEDASGSTVQPHVPSLQQPVAQMASFDTSNATAFSSIPLRPFTLAAIPQRKRKTSFAAHQEGPSAVKRPQVEGAANEASAAKLDQQQGKSQIIATSPIQWKTVAKQRAPALAATHPSAYNTSSALLTGINRNTITTSMTQYPVPSIRHATDLDSKGEESVWEARDDEAAVIAASHSTFPKTAAGFLVDAAPATFANACVSSSDVATHVHPRAVFPVPRTNPTQLSGHEKRRDSVGSHTSGAASAEQAFTFQAPGWSPSCQLWVDPTHHTSTKLAGAKKPIVGYPLARDGTVSDSRGTMSVVRMIQLPFGSVTELGYIYPTDAEARRKLREEDE